MAEYTVELPSKAEVNEIGLHFETDWQERNIVIRSYNKYSFAAGTEIQLGDVLLAVDGEYFTGQEFEKAMAKIKEKRLTSECVLTLRTVEEKMRLIRCNADGRGGVAMNNPSSSTMNNNNNNNNIDRSANGKSIMDNPTVLSIVTKKPGLTIRPFAKPTLSTIPSGIEVVDDLDDVIANNTNAIPSPTKKGTISTARIDYSNYPSPQPREFHHPRRLASSTHHTAPEDNMFTEFFSENDTPEQLFMRMEVRQVEASILVLIQNASEKDLQYKIHNQSLYYILAYKQKNVPGNRWRILGPGKIVNYIWDDPFKPHKLIVRIGNNILCPKMFEEDPGNIVNLISNVTNDVVAQPVNNPYNDESNRIVNFDEIGFHKELPIPQSPLFLYLDVSSEGPSKTLTISPINLPTMNQIKSLTDSEVKDVQMKITQEIIFTSDMLYKQIELLTEVIKYFNDKLYEAQYDLQQQPAAMMYDSTNTIHNVLSEMDDKSIIFDLKFRKEEMVEQMKEVRFKSLKDIHMTQTAIYNDQQLQKNYAHRNNVTNSMALNSSRNIGYSTSTSNLFSDNNSNMYNSNLNNNNNYIIYNNRPSFSASTSQSATAQHSPPGISAEGGGLLQMSSMSQGPPSLEYRRSQIDMSRDAVRQAIKDPLNLGS